jgi:hypothetical protein
LTFSGKALPFCQIALFLPVPVTAMTARSRAAAAWRRMQCAIFMLRGISELTPARKNERLPRHE